MVHGQMKTALIKKSLFAQVNDKRFIFLDEVLSLPKG